MARKFVQMNLGKKTQSAVSDFRPVHAIGRLGHPPILLRDRTWLIRSGTRNTASFAWRSKISADLDRLPSASACSASAISSRKIAAFTCAGCTWSMPAMLTLSTDANHWANLFRTAVPGKPIRLRNRAAAIRPETIAPMTLLQNSMARVATSASDQAGTPASIKRKASVIQPRPKNKNCMHAAWAPKRAAVRHQSGVIRWEQMNRARLRGSATRRQHSVPRRW